MGIGDAGVLSGVGDACGEGERHVTNSTALFALGVNEWREAEGEAASEGQLKKGGQASRSV